MYRVLSGARAVDVWVLQPLDGLRRLLREDVLVEMSKSSCEEREPGQTVVTAHYRVLSTSRLHQYSCDYI